MNTSILLCQLYFEWTKKMIDPTLSLKMPNPNLQCKWTWTHLPLSFSVFPPQMQMLQVWLQLSEGTGWLQIPSLTEGGPGRMHIWSNSIRNKLEPILWRSCKWITEVGMGNHIFWNAYSLDHLYFVPSVNQISINIDCWVHVALYLKHHVRSVLNIQTGILNTLRTQVWFQWLLQLLSDI